MTSHKSPETLARIAGLPAEPSRPENSVLVMIDAQREYTVGRVPLANIGAAIEEGARLLAFARRAEMPVIHAVHHARPGAALFDPAGDGAKFIDALAPHATARSALDHGFRSTVVAGATATRDLPHPFGAGVTPAHVVQLGTLAALSDRFSVVIQDTSALWQGAKQSA